MAINYFDVVHAIEVHDELINQSGGILGIINRGSLESTLEHIQNDDYYPSFEDKLTHLFFSVIKNHSFNDGNKRSSIALSSYFLEINGFDFCTVKFMREMENIVVDVADNRIDKDLLFELLYSILNEQDYSEELKLKIIYAKSS